MMTKNGIQDSVAFTGKERDNETGYGYFGARYMDHELMTMWLSVDPMSDKYPGISPYAYCAWNPVKLVDPDGQDISGIKPPRHGIRLEMGKFSAQIGLVAGIGFSAYSGVARDQVGIVQFKCAKGDVCAPKKTNSSRVGGDFSISKVFAFNYKCRKFEDILHRHFGGVAAGFGGFSFDNEGTRMYSFGLGITAIEDVTSFDITSSISVTWEQWDRYANKNGGYTIFSVDENQDSQKIEMDGVEYFVKNLMYHDKKSCKWKYTGLKVYSRSENGEPNNQWKTKEYLDS